MSTKGNYAEMVVVLWEQGKKEAAIELEELWNEALNTSAFHLHCAYPRASFVKDVDDCSNGAGVPSPHAYDHSMTDRFTTPVLSSVLIFVSFIAISRCF